MYKSLNEVFEVLINKCSRCDKKIDDKPAESYNHPDGLEVEGYKEKQWCYKTCDCGYQTSHRKMKAKNDK